MIQSSHCIGQKLCQRNMRMRTVVEKFIRMLRNHGMQAARRRFEIHTEHCSEPGERNEIVFALLRIVRAFKLVKKCPDASMPSGKIVATRIGSNTLLMKFLL